MLKPTPDPKATLMNIFQSSTLNHCPWKRSVWVHGVIGLGAISGAAASQPSLPLYMVDNGSHCVSGRFKVGLGWLVNACSSHSIRRGKMDQADKVKEVRYGYKGGRF